MIGALIGGGIGLTFGGLAGALIGLLVGFVVEKFLLPQLWRRQSGADGQFIESTFAVMGALCKADGQVSKDELQTSSRFFDDMKLGDAERRHAMAAFVRGRQPGFDLEGEVRKLLDTAGSNRSLLLLFLYVQVSAVEADGALRINEQLLFERIIQVMRLDRGEQLQAQALLHGIGDGVDDPLEQQYRMLGVLPDIDDQGLEAAWQAQVENTSTEALTGAGVHQELQALSQLYLARLAKAHEQIKQSRAASAAGAGSSV